jgi:hypothetical protein
MKRAASLTFALALGAALAACETNDVDYYPCPPGMDCSLDGGSEIQDGGGTANDGGVSPVGGACQSSADCESEMLCVTDALLEAFGVNTTNITIPDGMCSAFCTMDGGASCGDGGTCQSGAAFGSPTTMLCLASCDSLTDCRVAEGYSCWTQNPASPNPVCLPDSVIASYYCPMGCQ